MTIDERSLDEAIQHAREVAEIQRNNDKLNKTLGKSSPYYNTDCIKCAEEHEQLVEWLEELKALREKNETLKALYEDARKEGNGLLKHERNKAIDDFVRFANTMPTVESEDGTIRPMWLEEIAEQLKAGGK